MNSDESALLQTIVENPDDDAPRLVYADWLDEHGQPERAEFIRVQCAAAQLPAGNPQRAELTKREQAILRDCLPVWKRELAGSDSIEWQFCRGLVSGVVVRSWPAFEKI